MADDAQTDAPDTGTLTIDATETKPIDATKLIDDVAKWKAMARKHEEAAKANASAAERLAAIEEASKTESQKLADRAAAAEAERDAARVEVMRFKVAAAHGLSEEDADLFLTGTDEETLTKQAKRLSDREGDRRKNGNYVAREGTTTTAPASDQREFARELFGTP